MSRSFAVLLLMLMPASAWSQLNTTSLLGKDGLIIGVGLGGGVASIRTESIDFGETSKTTATEGALTGDFKLGGGLGESVLLYWFGKAGWYNGPDSFGPGTQTSTIVGVNGVGATYILARRLGVGGGIGAASLTTSRQTYWGLGFFVGAEYEFARHWMVGLDALYGSPKPDNLPGVDRSVHTLVVKASLNWLYY